MYEERKEKFSFKSFFLTLLLVLLFVFLMLWIFPTRWDVNKLQSNLDIDRLSVLYDEIFANNIARMKDAAIGYFTNERMPSKVGESKKLTLGEMYDLHLLLKLKDKDGNPCDTEKSYVEMTKYNEEYRLKVNLSCGDDEDYIIVYLGCYDYCKGLGVCEKRVETTTPQNNPTNPSKPDNKPNNPPKEDPKPDNPLEKKYLYEYKIEVKDSTTCKEWSKWQKEEVKPTDLVKVETKTEEELTGYDTVKVPVTKTVKEKRQVSEKYIKDYITEVVLVGTKQVKVGTTKKTVKEEVVVGHIEVATGKVGEGTKVPQNTSSEHYKNITPHTRKSCSYCEDETYYTWDVYSVEPVYDVVEVTKDVEVFKTVNVYETREVPVYDFRTVEKEVEVTKTVYEEKQVPKYGKVKYYRYKTCEFKKGYTDVKWTENKIDPDLIGKGYKFTGNVKQV